MQRRRWVAIGKLALLPIGLAAATWLALHAGRPEPAPGAPSQAEPPAERPQPATIEFDRFSARRERSADGSRLTVSMRVRTGAEAGLPCFVFFVARRDSTTPRTWSIWPPQPPGAAITPSGHFHGATPNVGYAVTLTPAWQRLTATLPDPVAGPFDLVVVYVVGEAGGVLLSRPFRL